MQENSHYFSLVLHAHQPYVLHHGTWPHGTDWLLEAAVETYLPVLSMLRRLLADGIPLRANLSITPVLLEQLADTGFRAELPNYIERKISSAQEDFAFFQQAGEFHLAELAQHWKLVFQRLKDEVAFSGGDLVAGFRQAEEAGCISLMTSAATHCYAPLVGTDESLRAQFRTAVDTHRQHLGRQPRGIWLPECGYRPAGTWRYPVPHANLATQPVQQRMGVEQALAEAGLRYTFVDSHLVDDADPAPAYAGDESAQTLAARIYQAHTVADSQVAVFARDPRSAFQVWSPQFGYPGDFEYLDFHKKRWPGGHRYWRVTGESTGIDEKLPYQPAAAAERCLAHAKHFVALLSETLRATSTGAESNVLCAPFDLELFGHWWHEGLQFLEHVARELAAAPDAVQPVTCSQYLRQYPPQSALRMREGSWGSGGDSSVWLNGETAASLAEVYAAELAVRAASGKAAWTDNGTGERIARQLCRELLLMQSSDWPTLVTTGAARDYAERRFEEHRTSFAAVLELWQDFLLRGADPAALDAVLLPLETRDAVFPDLKPAYWQASKSVDASAAGLLRRNGAAEGTS